MRRREWFEGRPTRARRPGDHTAQTLAVVRVAERALALDPDDLTARSLRAVAQLDLERLDDAAVRALSGP